MAGELPAHVDFGGSGPAILLLHGLMGRANNWWPVAQWLTGHGRVVALDARGHGRNPRDGRSITSADFVADAAAAITGLDLGPTVVIGHSMGGLHSWLLAASHPDLVRAVVVEEFAPDQRGRTVETWRPWFDSWPLPFRSLAHLYAFFGDPVVAGYFAEGVVERADGYHLIADFDDLYEIAAEWGERGYWPEVDQVRCPLLAVEAEHSLMPPRQMAELAARAPGNVTADAPRHLIVPSAGHVVHLQQPDAYRKAVESFLAEVLPTT